jgi:hypothetical protein
MPVRFHRIYPLCAVLKPRRRDTRDFALVVGSRVPRNSPERWVDPTIYPLRGDGPVDA